MLARVIFHVQDPQGRPLPGVLLSAKSDPGPWLGRTNDAGDFDANPGLAPGHYTIEFTTPGYYRKLEADIADPGTITVGLDPAVQSGLHVEGLNFVLNGQVWRMVFADSFRAYERFLKQGPDSIRPVFAELQALGANGVRVLGSFDFGSPDQQRLYPGEHGDAYYDRLQEFFHLAGEYGLFVQFCVFADTKRSVPGAGYQRSHFSRVCDRLRGTPNLLLQLVNEGNQHENGLDTEIAKPAGILASSGSHGTGDDPPQPFWDYSDLGSERRGDFALSTTTVNFAIKGYAGENGNPGFPGTGRATVVSEPPGFGEATTGSRTNDPRIAYQLGLGTKWGAGGTAHSDCGVHSVLLSPTQKECVQQFILGAK